MVGSALAGAGASEASVVAFIPGLSRILGVRATARPCDGAAA